ncbi:hypothetical protein HHK36_024681 [Tetracentron sinense]|uniref:GCK domain-containing protein n=1 Tax=Tetracentron sinense TaxID=13715 RepID=A0A834YJS8_TETSI|nr:hypothetical protein HHK36_024681 [Tetracentron sinense]
MSSSASESLEIETPTISNPPPPPPPPPEAKTLGDQTPTEVSNPSVDNKTVENQQPEVSDQSNVSGKEEDGEGEEDEDEDEEEGECGFCLFMKGGGCKENFIAWEKCVEDGEKNKEDIVEKCFEITGLLKKCMDAHADYYEPILKAEKAAEEEAMKELEQEAASKDSERETTSNDKHSQRIEQHKQISIFAEIFLVYGLKQLAVDERAQAKGLLMQKRVAGCEDVLYGIRYSGMVELCWIFEKL